MDVRILGPLEVWRDGIPAEVAGIRLRALLVRLALGAGGTVGTAALVDAVWADDPPAEPANALQSLVSRLRRSLGDGGLVRQSAGGYQLAVEPDAVDAHRFERLVRDGAAAVRAGEHARAATVLRDALALWRGPALADVADRAFAAAPAARLADLRLSALADRIDADLALGRAREVVAELDGLTAEHPLDERLASQLITALYQAGRQADALAAYDRLRTRLADELGIDPAPETQAGYLAVLRADPALDPPAPAPPDRPRTNLRAPLSSFVGREDELGRVTKLLAESRLVTLVGAGGAGKTRLVSQAAAGWVEEYPDGVWFVELAPVTDAAQLPPALLGSLGLRESDVLTRPDRTASADPVNRLLDALAELRCVLVLDNCEHLIGPVAELVDTLLARCPLLRIVCTSREPLGLTGENLSIVPPLGQPAPGVAAAEALAYPAVQLFADRAAAVSPDFAVDDRTAGAVVEICRRLDGLPLAIELAAARLRSLPVEHLAARLDDRFRLLTGGSRVVIARHRTLRAVVEWSWDLLTGPERRLAERIAVFPAGVTPTSAETVCAGPDLPAAEVFDLLAALVDKSLLQVAAAGGPRYRMLETIREYGLERLAERGELAATRTAHARYFADFIRTAEAHLRSADQLDWLAQIDAERDNVGAGLRYLADSGDADRAVAMAGAFSSYWMMLGGHSESAAWLGYALAAPGEVDPLDRLVAEVGYLLNTLMSDGTGLDAEAHLQRLRRLSDELEGVSSTGRPMLQLMKPLAAMFAGNEERSRRLLDEALAGPDPWVRAASRMMRANLAENNGDTELIRSDAAAGIEEFRRIGDRWGLAGCLSTYGRLCTLDGDLAGAVEQYREACGLLRELGAVGDQVWLRLWLADLQARRGDLAAAHAELRWAEELADQAGARQHRFFILAGRAGLARYAGDPAEARRLQDEAERQVRRYSTNHPIFSHGVAVIQAGAALIEIAVGDGATARATLREAYRAAVSTKDMPIVAAVGVAVADLARLCDRPAEAAELLGAVARLAGAVDPTNVDIRRITGELRDRLGDAGFDAAYARGHDLDRPAAIAHLDPTAGPAAAR